MGPRASQVRAQYHQLARAEAWAAQNSQPILSFSFCHPFPPLFSFFPCTEVLEALVGPSKGIPRTGVRGFGPLTQQPENPEPGGYSGHQSLRTAPLPPAPGFLLSHLKQVPKL